MNISGLHHVTAIASDPQRNLNFYAGVLGLRLVKRTVNFDDPGSYHFYYGDAVGTPGTILTFFLWPNARRGVRGIGEVEATAFAVPVESTGYWLNRLHEHKVSVAEPIERFGETVIRFADSDGMNIELVASDRVSQQDPFSGSSVPEVHAIRGLHGVTALLDDTENSARLLTDVFGYRLTDESENRARYSAQGQAGLGKELDLLTATAVSEGRSGAGTVHHIAFRVATAKDQLDWQKRITNLGYKVSAVMDRTYFQSIYFREPGGILFEIATDVPGFTTDEQKTKLGASLRLPAWMERSRTQIEALLPAIIIPSGVNS
jgi:glyoxalase family protein